MKKILIITLLFLQSIISNAQWEILESDTNIEKTFVNKKMFEMMSKVKNNKTLSNEDKKFKNLTKNLSSLTVFKGRSSSVKNNIKNCISKFVEKYEFQPISEYTDAQKDIHFYYNKGANKEQVSELIMHINNASQNQTTLLILKGNFALKDLAVLTTKMNISTGVSF